MSSLVLYSWNTKNLRWYFSECQLQLLTSTINSKANKYMKIPCIVHQSLLEIKVQKEKQRVSGFCGRERGEKLRGVLALQPSAFVVLRRREEEMSFLWPFPQCHPDQTHSDIHTPHASVFKPIYWLENGVCVLSDIVCGLDYSIHEWVMDAGGVARRWVNVWND